ncbi:MAG: L,D-transpeptidase family protein [Rhodospirillaceae bacterium]
MVITVTQTQPGPRHRGRLTWPGGAIDCALGRSGLVRNKREGDGGTPVGRVPMRRLFYRPDRLSAPETRLPALPLGRGFGWCDDPESPAYNRLVRLPSLWGHETMWRDDPLYDLVVVLGHNDAPPAAGNGSAIFLHVAAEGLQPTEGCVAVRRDDLLKILKFALAGDTMEIG